MQNKKWLPSFLKNLDRYLLLNHPSWWILKPHYLLFFNGIYFALSLLFCWLYPQSLGNFPPEPIILLVIISLGILINLLWLFIAHQFDLRTRFKTQPGWWELGRVLSTFLAFSFIFLTALYSDLTLKKQTISLVSPLDKTAFDQIDSTVNDFSSNWSNYAEGFHIERTYYNNGRRPKIDTIALSDKVIIERFDKLGKLNAKYGDGKKLEGNAILPFIRDSTETLANGRIYRKTSNERTAILSGLSYNVRKVSSSFRHVDDFYDDFLKTLSEVSTFLLGLVTVLLLLIAYFKFFGIYGLISGILAPALCGLLTAILFSITNLGRTEEVAYAFVFAVLSAVILVFAYGSSHRSKTKTWVIQSLGFLIPAAVLLAYASANHSYHDCGMFLPQSRDSYNECIEAARKQKVLVNWIFLAVYALLILPIWYKAIFKWYSLPKK